MTVATDQFTGDRDGERPICTGQRNRLARAGRYLSRGLSGSHRNCVRHGGDSIERRLDCGTGGEHSYSVRNAPEEHTVRVLWEAPVATLAKILGHADLR